MTQEQLTKLRSMTKLDIMRKYLPFVRGSKITPGQYEWLIRQGCDVHDGGEPRVSNQTLGDSGGDDGTSSESDDTVQLLVSEFGGKETTHTNRRAGTSQKSRLLALLKDGEWHDTVEIMHTVYFQGLHGSKPSKGNCRISARIGDLKKEGHHIRSRKKYHSVWEYKLELCKN